MLMLNWLANELPEPTCFCPVTLVYQACPQLPAFRVGLVDLKSCLHAFTASTLNRAIYIRNKEVKGSILKFVAFSINV